LWFIQAAILSLDGKIKTLGCNQYRQKAALVTADLATKGSECDTLSVASKAQVQKLQAKLAADTAARNVESQKLESMFCV